ncbi:Redoxin [Mycena metata]|uniref:Redoxin n=1 Tax=Mycena metata TaxID=1033252 RepID=A0AAD7IYR4_9AGAR|nr:Redoxin [Mycena metata]
MRPPASISTVLRAARLRAGPQCSLLAHRPSIPCNTAIRGRMTLNQSLRQMHNVASSVSHLSPLFNQVPLCPRYPSRKMPRTSPRQFVFPEGKHIIVGVPGAFTGTCHAQVPGYISQFEAFKAKGIQQISIVAMNDVFVLKAWKENLAPEGTPVRFISDDAGAFTTALGLGFDASPLLGGVRSKRYVIIANGDKIETIAIEEVPSQLTVTDAKTILAQLA